MVGRIPIPRLIAFHVRSFRRHKSKLCIGQGLGVDRNDLSNIQESENRSRKKISSTWVFFAFPSSIRASDPMFRATTI